MKFNYKTKPYKHQEDALEKSYNKKRTMPYFMEMGCGKSKVLIDNIAWLYMQKRNRYGRHCCTKRCLQKLGSIRNTNSLFLM